MPPPRWSFAASVVLVACILVQAQARGKAHDEVAVDLRPVAELAQRIAPWLAPDLVFRNIAAENGHDVFELASSGQRIVIRASSSSAAAAGFNWYLKYYCHRSISHRGDNIGPVSPLPKIVQPVRRVARFYTRYFLNYCTFNYSLSFADWNQWQRELDWMALNGINLALATNGFEAVWQNTLRRIGYSDQEILSFLPGPAYQAWWLMGNLEGWGGPQTQRMIDDRVALQKKILKRMKELGIEPVFQGFYGMVPASLAQKSPSARILDQGSWGGFQRPKILLSSDPLFARVSKIYYEELTRLYGPAHYFGGDLFHEGGKADGLDIASLARGVQDAMQRANPDAVWVLQGWQENPRDELLNGLRRDRILVLSLDADWEKRKGFNGSPWVWGTVNNFGEVVGLFGDLNRVAADPGRALNSVYGRNLKGIGALMEGINNNPVFYELLFESNWHNKTENLQRWLAGYAQARYGRTIPTVERAWTLLAKTAYTANSGPESIFCARPSLNVNGASTWGRASPTYDTEKLEEAARQFLAARTELHDVPTYQADVVDIVRQVITNRGLAAYHRMTAAFQSGDLQGFQKSSDEFLVLLRRQNRLLATRKEFLLGNWLAQAKGLAGNEGEAALLEKNARAQITYWGPDDPKTDLHDYAHKEWSGLLADYYLPRWEMFIADLNARLRGTPSAHPDYFSFEKHWTEQRNPYPATPAGDPIETAWRAFVDSVQ